MLYRLNKVYMYYVREFNVWVVLLLNFDRERYLLCKFFFFLYKADQISPNFPKEIICAIFN